MTAPLAFKKRNLSAFSNFLLSKYEMYTGAGKVASSPYYLCLDPSDVCQLRCPTCPTGLENESRRQKSLPTVYRSERRKLSPDLCAALLDELGERLFLVMFYNYGEPLLNPRLPELVHMASTRGITTEVHSNLSLTLSDGQIDALLGSGLDRLSASVDGFSQETYEVHRVGGNLELVKRNLERLAARRARLGVKTEIFYKFLVFKHNEHEIEAAQKFSDDLGITFAYGDAFIHDPRWLPRHREQEEPYYSAAEVEALIARWNAAGYTDYFFDHEHHPFWSIFPKQAEARFPAACAWHYGFSVVSAAGHVAPCCAVAKEQDDFGSVQARESSFADVWNNDLYVASRLAFAGKPRASLEHVETVCLRCYFPKYVQHVYSMYDPQVATRFREVFGASEPAMAEAFDLLAGDGDPASPAQFVAHCERRLGFPLVTTGVGA